METFSALLAICAGNSPFTGEFTVQRPVTRSFDVFLDLRLTKRVSKQWWGWWFETPPCPLWRHRNVRQQSKPPLVHYIYIIYIYIYNIYMVCRLFGAGPFPEPIMAYFKSEYWEQMSIKFESQHDSSHSRKCKWHCRLQTDDHLSRLLYVHSMLLKYIVSGCLSNFRAIGEV